MSVISCYCRNQKIDSGALTIYFFFHWGVGMEYIECMDEFLKFNNTIFLFIKKIKNLEKQKAH